MSSVLSSIAAWWGRVTKAPTPPGNEDKAKQSAQTGASDEYWLAVGAELIKTRVSRIETAADKYVTGIAWFWTVYTASALVGVSLADRALSPVVLVLAALPSIVLIYAYVRALQALSPVDKLFDPRVPEDIKQAENARRTEKLDRFKVTERATIVGAVTVAVAIVAVLSSPESRSTTFSAKYEESTTTAAILFAGRIQGADSIPVTIRLLSATDPFAEPLDMVMDTTSTSGEVEGSFENVDLQAYTVELGWDADDRHHSVSAEVAPPR